MLELSTAEQKLIEFAREEFGECLTQFLLAGLGEDGAGRKWKLTISYTGEGKSLKRQVQALSHEPEDGTSLLPRRRNPLVLLALLRLSRDTQSPGDGLLYDQKDVLQLLGWDDTSTVRDEMDEAVQRYFLLMFSWKMNRTELDRDNLTRYTAMERIISEYETLDQEEEGRVRRTSNRIVFSPIFIEHLRLRSLFGIDWTTVSSVTKTSQR